MKKFLYVLIIVIIINSVLFSLDPAKRIDQYLLKIWTNKDGLPQSSVTSIIQTQKGYLWLGTQEGMVRFDGLNMTVFNQRNVSELKSNMINCMIEDGENNLWIGTMNGLLRHKDGDFKIFTTNEGLVFNLIRSLGLDPQGNLWIGTDHGICKYKDGKFIEYSLPDASKNDYLVAILTDRNGEFWVATKEEIFKLAGEKFVVQTQSNIIGSEINTIYFDTHNILWIGSVSNGLFKYSNKQVINFSSNSNFSGNNVTVIREDSDGNLWVGTQNGGINRINNEKIDVFAQADGLSNNYILDIYEDFENNLWIGTSGNGLNCLRDGKVTVFGPSDGLTSDDSRTVFEDSKGVLWVGSDDGTLSKYDGKNFVEIQVQNEVKGNVIRSLGEDPEGNIWVGTVGSGIVVVSDQTAKKLELKDSTINKQIYSILKASDDSMWIGTASGIYKYKDNKLSHFGELNGTPLNSIRIIAEDNTGDIWFSIEGRGIGIYKNGSFEVINKNTGLSSNIVTAIYFERDNTVWVGTYGGGLNRIKDNKIKNITEKNGLTDDVIYTILESSGKLWMSSNRGIFNVEKSDFERYFEGEITSVSCIGFNESSGMKNQECNGGNSPAGWKDKSGILWFPTVQGVVKIDSKNIKSSEDFPPLIIENVFVDGKFVDLKKDIVIEPGYRRIQFQYTTLSFRNSKNIRFRVRLNGLDEEWVEMDGDRKAFYTMIPPDEYSFEVTSTNGEGRWNEEFVSLKVKLKPFFYQRTSFLIFIGCFLILSVLLFFKWRIGALRRRQQELELEVKNRTLEIRSKNKELQKLSIVARETDNGVIITGIEGKPEWVNEGFERMYGYNLDQLIEERGINMVEFSLREDFKEIFDNCIAQKKPVLYESSNKDRSGKIIWTQTSLTPILGEKGEVKQLIFVETNISKLKEAYQEMKKMSLTDPLTKLNNRRYFHNLIDRDIQIARRKLLKKAKKGLIYSMLFLMIDIDYFKKVNDVYGHKAGDSLLVRVSNRMRDTLRTSDLLVRWGGEEFLVMSKDDNFEGAHLLSKRLLKVIEEEAFNLDGTKIEVSVSIGYCGYPILPEDPDRFGWEDIVHLADSALYIAKNSGRKRSVGVKMIYEKMDKTNCEMIKKHFHKSIDQGIINVVTTKSGLADKK